MQLLPLLVASGFVLLPIVALLIAIRALSLAKARSVDPQLQRRVSMLESQLAALRRTVGTLSAAAPAAPVRPSAAAPSAPPSATLAPESTPARTASAAAASPPGPRPRPASMTTSLEERIGARWTTWIGVLALLFAAAFFLQWSIKNGIIGPRAQVALGLLAGIALFIGGLVINPRRLPYLSSGLAGGGLAILYLSMWAAFARYGFIGAAVAFGTMSLVTAAGALAAVVSDRQPVAVLAVLGGLLTPLLVTTGVVRELVLLGYLLVLDILVLAVARYRSWPGLNRLAWVGTFLLLAPVISERPEAPHPVARLALLTALFLLFLWVPLARAWAERAPVRNLDLVLVAGNALAYFSAVYLTLERWRPALEAPWALLLAALYAVVALRVRERLPRDRVTHALHLATAAVLVTLAIPLALDGPWVTLAWGAQGVAFAWVARQGRSPVAPAGALVVLAMAAFRVVVLDPLWFPVDTPVWNPAFPVHLAVVGCLAWAGWLVAGLGEEARQRTGLGGEELQGLFWVVGAMVLAALLWREPTGSWPAALLILELVFLAALVGVFESRALVLATAALALIVVARIFGEDDALARRAAESLINLPLLVRLAACAAFAVAGQLLSGARGVVGAAPLGRLFAASAGVLPLVVLSAGWVEHELWVRRAISSAEGAAAASRIDLRLQVGLSVLWTLYAAVAVAWGFARSLPPVRYAGLGLFGIVILKVFLIDLASLEAIYRIASFLVLGLVLLAVSYAYQRLFGSKGGG